VVGVSVVADAQHLLTRTIDSLAILLGVDCEAEPTS
jgi:hypothetical protein